MIEDTSTRVSECEVARGRNVSAAGKEKAMVLSLEVLQLLALIHCMKKRKNMESSSRRTRRLRSNTPTT